MKKAMTEKSSSFNFFQGESVGDWKHFYEMMGEVHLSSRHQDRLLRKGAPVKNRYPNEVNMFNMLKRVVPRPKPRPFPGDGAFFIG